MKADWNSLRMGKGPSRPLARPPALGRVTPQSTGLAQCRMEVEVITEDAHTDACTYGCRLENMYTHTELLVLRN